jgi:hypothetical protein
MQGTVFTSPGPEYGIRRNGKTFAMTCLNLRDAREMATVLGKDGEQVEIFVVATGQTIVYETGPGEIAGLPTPPYSASD